MLGKGLGALKSGGNVTPLGAMVAFFFLLFPRTMLVKRAFDVAMSKAKLLLFIA